MFKPIKGGSVVEIQGLKCQLPPPGYVFNKFANKVEKKGIYKRSRIKEKQYWEVPPKPENVKERLIEEAERRKNEPTYFDTELQKYREQEWDRRINGFWFYNNGKATYITGTHYFYLAHWQIDIGYPSFRIPNMEVLYFWDYCVNDPRSYGMVEVTCRRDGKCLEIGESVRMYDGSVKKVGDIINGDLLMGSDGSPRVVSNCHEGIDVLYNVIPNKGKAFMCNGEHLLTLFHNKNARNKKRGWEARSFIEIPTREYNALKESEKTPLVLVRIPVGGHLLFETTKIKVKKGRIGKYRGWEVDGDRRFLLEDGTIIHNSYRAACIQYEATSRTQKKRSGIQSKDEPSAQEFFEVKMVQPFTELEIMFRPSLDPSKGDIPKKMLAFFKGTIKSKSAIEIEKNRKRQELKSLIDFKSASEKAYDGQKQLIYIRDEAGKVEGASVYEAHATVKWCLVDGLDVIGKALYTTTVEDIKDDDDERGNFKTLWDKSDQDNRKKNGKTITGLYRYFLPAYRALNFDIYGFPAIEENKVHLMNEREGLEGVELASYIRKYPFSIDEAFWTSAEECIFDKVRIQRVRQELALIEKKDIYVTGNLHWKDKERGGQVIFTKSPRGKFKFLKEFDIEKECSLENSMVDWEGLFSPLKKADRIIGVDPVDHSVDSKASAEYRKSKAAAHLYIKYNPGNPLSETFVAEYLNRPKNSEVFFEDMCLLSFATGANLIIENNKPGLINYCIKTGFEAFLIRFANTNGIAASPKSHKLLADNWEIYISTMLEKLKFDNVLSDLSKFNLIKTTKFDAAMSAGWALVGAYGDRASGITQRDNDKPKCYDPKGFY